MTDRHLRTAFLDLVDGHGLPHPEHRRPSCAACRKAGELRVLFERDLETAMKEMAPQALPPGTLGLPPGRVSLAWLPIVTSVAAALLVIGVAIAAPDFFPVGRGTAPGTGTPTASAAATPHPAINIHRQRASEAQQPYFADGVIDADDYRAAVESTVACMRAEGFQFRAELADDGYYQYTGQYTGPAGPVMSEALDTCREEHSQEVELAYQEITGPTEDEMPAVRAVIACLSAAGRPPTSGHRPDQLREFIDELPRDDPARECGQRLPQE